MEWLILAAVLFIANGLFTLNNRVSTLIAEMKEMNITQRMWAQDWRQKNGPWPEPHPFDEF